MLMELALAFALYSQAAMHNSAALAHSQAHQSDLEWTRCPSPVPDASNPDLNSANGERQKRKMSCALDQECVFYLCQPEWEACESGCYASYPPGPTRTACIAACDQSYYECYYPACCLN